MAAHQSPINEFDLEQYRALRAEVLRSMEDGNQIMSFGLATVGLLVGGGFAARDSVAGFLVFATLLPILSALVLSLWFAAQERTARASHFLSGLEARLQPSTGSAGPTWEQWLRGSGGDDHHHFLSTELSAIAMAVLIIVTSFTFAFVLETPAPIALQLLFATPAFVLVVLVLTNVRSRFLKWRMWLTTDFVDPTTTGQQPAP